MKLFYIIRKKYRSYFWNKVWYKRIVLFWLRSFMGKKVLTPKGWMPPSIAFRDGELWDI